MLGGLPADKQTQEVAALTAYVMSLQGNAVIATNSSPGDAQRGSEIYHSIGCVACHGPRQDANTPKDSSWVSLEHLPGKYQPGHLAAFLQQPLHVRSSGRMPDMKLTSQQARDIATFLDGAPEHANLQKSASSDADMIAAGRQAFTAHRCTACHDVPSPDLTLPPSMPPARSSLRPDHGCLSETPGTAPHFNLSPEQRTLIRATLSAQESELNPASHINITFTQLNCLACHQRDEFGGVPESLDSFFHSTEEALGNESRLPPPLTLIGAKLRPEWLRRVLYDGAEARPYISTRMPRFGDQALDGLVEWLGQVDRIEPHIELQPPLEKELRAEMRKGAMTLLGDKGLNCIACHNYNGRESPGMKGIDIMSSFERLQPTWFYHYMVNPQRFRPGVIMPSYWPGEQALQTTVLEGDTLLQMRAMWDHFSLGQSAGIPSGMREERTLLEVTDLTRVYRGRSNIAGYRGIAVGFPGGMNYVFDAHNGSLAALWQGAFVDVNWRGQGAGNFSPLVRPHLLERDVEILPGSIPPEPWPTYPKITKERPINPDPLYPARLGYRFMGYALDQKQNPTFRYRCGDVLVNESVSPVIGPHGNAFLRTLKFSASASTSVLIRPLSGNVLHVCDYTFATPTFSLEIDPASAWVRSIDEEQREVLIHLPLSEGVNTFSLRYDLLP